MLVNANTFNADSGKHTHDIDEKTKEETWQPECN